jgi:hypothetical protein
MLLFVLLGQNDFDRLVVPLKFIRMASESKSSIFYVDLSIPNEFRDVMTIISLNYRFRKGS